jgi:hypothetical protein
MEVHMKDVGSLLTDSYSWIRSNDLPNWLVVIFTGIFWPLVLYFWTRRKVRNVPNLEVSLSQCRMRISGKKHDGVNLNFLNNTGSVVYITNARLLKCSPRFPIPPEALRDIAEFSHELKFLDNNTKRYIKRQITLHTNEEAVTCIALRELDKELLLFKLSWIRRLLRKRKYFCLEYVAMVGNHKYKVYTAY